MKLLLTISYDGSSFAGWQSQSHHNTIQDILEKALFKIAGRPLILHGAGRTDAGVHALAQSAHVDVGEVSKKMSDPRRWRSALNAALPSSIRILEVKKINDSFHSRFSAHSKTYRYLIWNDDVLPPLLDQRALHVYGKLDWEVLKKMLTAITGTHDFRGFTAKSGALKKNTERTIYAATMTRKGKEVRLTFHGNGFLYHMIRMLVGSMLRVAQGKDSLETFLHRLYNAKPPIAPHTAPACGLYLVNVRYQKR